MTIGQFALMFALLVTSTAYADELPKSLLATGPELGCDEIAIETLRLYGRLNQIELESIGAAKGKADAATVAQLVFFPALFLRQPQPGLDEHAWLTQELAILRTQSVDRKCGSSESNALPTTTTGSATNASLAPSDGDYERALTELESGRLVKAPWARALAESNGIEAAAKSIYIKLRVEQLARERSLPR